MCNEELFAINPFGRPYKYAKFPLATEKRLGETESKFKYSKILYPQYRESTTRELRGSGSHFFTQIEPN